MQKIACIFSFKESTWVSCQKIVFNLHEAYSRLKDTKILNYNYSMVSEKADFRNLAQEIFDENPDVISIIDHKPHPHFFFEALIPLYAQAKRKLPKFMIHIFGDFTLYYPHWEKSQKLLKGASVQFLVASPRQKILVDRMLTDVTSIVCPFPVNSEEFFPATQLRQQCRKAWGIGEKDFAYVFTGRLSRQKRIKTLITTFNTAFAKNPNVHLFIYGCADSVGDPFMAQHDTEAEYFRSFYRRYRELAPEVQARIHFMGAVPNRELIPVYQGADAFVNLSVHNDEDYGMSIAEATCSGLPCALTDWGGLAGFEHPELPEATRFIPVTIGLKNKKIRQEDVVSTLLTGAEKFKLIDRNKLAQLSLGKFGIEASSAILEQTLAQPFPVFEKFSPLFTKAVRANLNQPFKPPFRTLNNQINNLYREIYSAYVRPN